MAQHRPIPRRRNIPARPRIGIALAGGGPVGAIYELGVLRALEDALDGVDLTDLGVYVGVSAGGFMASALANGIAPKELYRIVIASESADFPFKPELFLQPAFREFAKRALSVPGLLGSAAWHYVAGLGRRGLLESFQQLGSALPAGILPTRWRLAPRYRASSRRWWSTAGIWSMARRGARCTPPLRSTMARTSSSA